MKVLLTGSEGLIGAETAKQLAAKGHHVVGFDLKAGDDIRNASAVIRAGRGCDAVVHLAALLGNSDSESAEEISRTNLLGTWHVLESARINTFGKVIFMSSVDSLGIFKGEGAPTYFPIDDAHPCSPATPYAISKKLGEEMCQTFSQINNIPAVCLRPPGVWNEQTYRYIVDKRRERPEYEWDPYWEYGAFIDVRDLAALVVRSLETDIVGYHCYLVASDDITTSGQTSLVLAQRLFPQIKWTEREMYRDDPYHSLINCRPVKDAFQWSPEYSWRRFVAEQRVT